MQTLPNSNRPSKRLQETRIAHQWPPPLKERLRMVTRWAQSQVNSCSTTHRCWHPRERMFKMCMLLTLTQSMKMKEGLMMIMVSTVYPKLLVSMIWKGSIKSIRCFKITKPLRKRSLKNISNISFTRNQLVTSWADKARKLSQFQARLFLDQAQLLVHQTCHAHLLSLSKLLKSCP